eukprot:NODE_1883_length_1768_cov_31.280243_g1600_i0.p1 GENE.NODE_1883_length_1768_cov_31.280243_g1600_i0~~NODE_1883_length_1768_cov_31.280243_g1600_i0.p1  ORF type:complete len:575 (-),score=70.25 NODE_1883_length_1768_cov_31.280243_g1600_i0:2-1726(-)
MTVFGNILISIKCSNFLVMTVTGLLLSTTVFLISANTLNKVVDYEMQEGSNLLNKCFDNAKEVQQLSFNHSIRNVRNISSNLVLISINHIMEQIDNVVFSNPIISFDILKQVFIGRQTGMKTWNDLYSAGELVWQSLSTDTISQLFISDWERIRTIVYVDVGLSFIYDKIAHSFINYAFDKQTGKILLRPTCLLNIPEFCIYQGAMDSDLLVEFPPDNYNTSNPFYTHVVAIPGTQTTYIVMYYPIITNGERLGWIGRYLDTSRISSLLSQISRSLKGHFMYIVDERQILIGVSEGRPYYFDPSTRFAEQLHILNSTSQIIKSTGQYIINTYGSHINAPKTQDFQMEFNYNGTLYTLFNVPIQQYNLLWWIIYGIPNDEIFGSVSKVNEIITNNMKNLETSTKKEVDKSNNESNSRRNSGLIGIIIWSGVLFVLCLINSRIFSWVISTHLTRVIYSLETITSSDDTFHSFLMEIAMINHSIQRIKDNINLLKSHLPTNMFHPESRIETNNYFESSGTIVQSPSPSATPGVSNHSWSTQSPYPKTNTNNLFKNKDIIPYRLNLDILRQITPCTLR